MYRHNYHSLIQFFWGIVLFSGCSSINAAESSWQDELSFNGFYTLDATYSDSDIPIISNGNVFRSLEANQTTLKNSLFGLQARYNFSDDLSVFLQGVTLFDNAGDLDASLDWAYLSYDMGRDFSFRLGKFQIPLLQGIELKSIGYSRLWARPMSPGTGAGGFTDYTGMELLKNVALENSNLSIQMGVGKSEHGLDQIEGKTLGLISAKYDTSNFWIRAALLHTDYTIYTPNGQLIDGNAQAVMASLEAEFTVQNFIINTGISDTHADNTPNDGLAYLSIGYQFGDFTPYVVGKTIRQRFTSFNPPRPPMAAPPAGPGPPPPRPPAPPDGNNNYDSLALGFRWDLNENHAVKIQWEYIDIEDDSRAERGTVSESGNVLSVLFEGFF